MNFLIEQQCSPEDLQLEFEEYFWSDNIFGEILAFGII
jgi:hypothetical protein